MEQSLFSLSRYLQAPSEFPYQAELGDPEVLRTLLRFLSLWNDPMPMQWRCIKKAAHIIVEKKVMQPFAVHLIREKKPQAYMKDCGEIYFSTGALTIRSSVVTLSVFCHELAHMWLSQQDFYPALKSFDKQFKTQFSAHPSVYLMSPIELYAMMIAIGMMREVASFCPQKSKRHQKLCDLIEDECEKVKTLTHEISMLPCDYHVTES